MDLELSAFRPMVISVLPQRFTLPHPYQPREIDFHLEQAIVMKNIPEASRLFSLGANPNGYHKDSSFLAQACMMRSKDIVTLLLKAGARPDANMLQKSVAWFMGTADEITIIASLLDEGITFPAYHDPKDKKAAAQIAFLPPVLGDESELFKKNFNQLIKLLDSHGIHFNAPIDQEVRNAHNDPVIATILHHKDPNLKITLFNLLNIEDKRYVVAAAVLQYQPNTLGHILPVCSYDVYLLALRHACLHRRHGLVKLLLNREVSWKKNDLEDLITYLKRLSARSSISYRIIYSSVQKSISDYVQRRF